jgi:hypothetical protein
MTETKANYPVNLTIDYPETSDKLTVFFRIFTVIPILIIWGLLIGGQHDSASAEGTKVVYYGTGFVFIPTLLMILFRQKYPRWWFDWNLNLAKFGARVFAYLLFLRDEYPSTDDEQSVHIELPYPDVQTELVHWMPLVKWLLAIPHFIVLAFLSVAVIVCEIISWFAILINGSYPRSLFDFVVGVMRWWYRVVAYAIILTTDQYPPFTLSE